MDQDQVQKKIVCKQKQNSNDAINEDISKSSVSSKKFSLPDPKILINIPAFDNPQIERKLKEKPNTLTTNSKTLNSDYQDAKNISKIQKKQKRKKVHRSMQQNKTQTILSEEEKEDSDSYEIDFPAEKTFQKQVSENNLKQVEVDESNAEFSKAENHQEIEKMRKIMMRGLTRGI